MNLIKTFVSLVRFLTQRKKFWLLPIVLIFGLVGILVASAEGSVFAPFIYTLF